MESHKSVQYGDEEDERLHLVATQAFVGLRDASSGTVIIMAPGTALELAKEIMEMAAKCQEMQTQEILGRSPFR